MNNENADEGTTSIRDTLESSFDSASVSATNVETSINQDTGNLSPVIPDETAQQQVKSAPESSTPPVPPASVDETKQPVQQTEEQAKAVARVNRPPQSWKGEGKQVWNELPLVARQEIHRREGAINNLLRDNAMAKDAISQVEQVFSPHMSWMSQANIQPLDAISSLMASEQLFRFGTPQQKADAAAEYIQSYGIDLNMLDAALAARLDGTHKPPAPNYDEMVQRAVDQRMAPFYQQQHALQQQEQNQLISVVNEFANDASHPYFEDLRDDMANIFDIAAQKGAPMDLQKAYKIAMSMHPELQQAAQLKTKQQQSNNLRGVAQSVSGSTQLPNANNQVDPTNIRALLEANFGEQ
jgi:hypothetical protein